MPIGRGLRRLARRDQAVGARPVVDDHWLAEGFRELRRDLPRADVGRAACGRRHEDLHRTTGKSLREGSRAPDGKNYTQPS